MRRRRCPRVTSPASPTWSIRSRRWPLQSADRRRPRLARPSGAGKLICGARGAAASGGGTTTGARAGSSSVPGLRRAPGRDGPDGALALQEAAGVDYSRADCAGSRAGSSRSPELDGGSLIDDAAGLIWRKVARREPGKLARYLQAGRAALHPATPRPGPRSAAPAARGRLRGPPLPPGLVASRLVARSAASCGGECPA